MSSLPIGGDRSRLEPAAESGHARAARQPLSSSPQGSAPNIAVRLAPPQMNPASSYEEIAYRESERLIETQLASFDELRSRTGLLLAALAVTGSFLGAAVLDREGDFGVFGILALTAFGIGVLACLLVLLPSSPSRSPGAGSESSEPPARRSWQLLRRLRAWKRRSFGGYTFVLSPKSLLEWTDGRYGDVTAMQRFIAEKREDHFDANKGKIDQLFMAFRVAIVATGFQVVFWALALA